MADERPSNFGPGPFQRADIANKEDLGPGTVWNPAGEIIQGEDNTPGTYTEMAKGIAKQMALPATLGGIGMGIGTLTGPASPVAVPVLGSLGGFAGETINQGLGITPESKLALALSALPIPMSKVAGASALRLPGAKAGLQDLVARNLGPTGEKLLNQIGPIMESGPLFARAEAAGANAKIMLPNTAQVVFDIRKELAQSPLKSKAVVRDLVNGADTLAGSGSVGVPYQNVRALQTGTGAKLRTLAVQGGEGSGQAKMLYKALWEDMDASLAQAQGPTGTLLRDAVAARKHEEAVDVIKEFFSPAHSRTGDAIVSVDAALNKAVANKDILARLLPDGAAGAEDLISALRSQVKLVNTPGTGVINQLAAHPYVGASLLTAGGALGSSNLMLGGGIAMGMALASEALATSQGRWLVRQLASKGIGIHQIGNALGQAAIAASTQGLSGGVTTSDITPPVTGGAPLRLGPPPQ